MLEMHYYALYYYEHALVYKASDWRMWQGLANCYTRLSRRTDAIKAYKRAVLAGSTDTAILASLALLSEQEGDIKSASSFHRQIISESIESGTNDLTPIATKSHLWFAMKEIEKQDYKTAEIHINEALKSHFVYPFLKDKVF
jgi:anaphase-promoting complex subunit 8